MEYIPVQMVRAHLRDLPQYSLPAGFTIKSFDLGDEHLWAEIETSAGEFANVEQALERFRKEFAGKETELRERCLFVVDPNGIAVGTAMGWYNDDFRGLEYGRLHWVSIRKNWQGRQLAKPLVGAACNCLEAEHQRAYLTSQTTSYKGIKVYLDFGFLPLMDTDRAEEAWRLVAQTLQHPILASYL